VRDLVYTGFMSLEGVVDSPGGGAGEEHRAGGWVVNDLEFIPEAWSLTGAVMPAYARPPCSQNTRPQRTPATDVIAVTCSLVHVHTVSIHGESDRRVSNRSSTGEGYAASRSGGSLGHAGCALRQGVRAALDRLRPRPCDLISRRGRRRVRIRCHRWRRRGSWSCAARIRVGVAHDRGPLGQGGGWSRCRGGRRSTGVWYVTG